MGLGSFVEGGLVAALPFALAACGGASLDVLGPGALGDGGATTDGSIPTADANAGDGGDRASFCAGQGSPIVMSARDAGTASACLGGLAQGAFRYALCTCEGVVSATSITTDSFDSDAGAYDPAHAKAGGSVGTNGNLSTNGTLTVGGALWGSDSSGMTVATAQASGDVHVAGPLSSGPSLTIGGDAYVLGNLKATGNLSIAGTLHQPSTSTASAGGTKAIGGTSNASFTVPPACDCDPALRVDVPAFVEEYRANNDDAALGLDPRALENVNSDLTLNLSCGRIFFTRVGGTGAIHLILGPGRTAIFVGGDLAPNGAFTVDVPRGSELDLFVEGNVVAGSTFMLGDSADPVSARLWVGGTGTINLQNAATLAGNVYAPAAELVLSASPTTIFGSAFVRRLSAQGVVTIHYDEAILAQGGSCPSAGGSCSSCHDCGNQACVAGVCGACTASTDCCAPLVCQGGQCVAGKIP